MTKCERNGLRDEARKYLQGKQVEWLTSNKMAKAVVELADAVDELEAQNARLDRTIDRMHWGPGWD